MSRVHATGAPSLGLHTHQQAAPPCSKPPASEPGSHFTRKANTAAAPPRGSSRRRIGVLLARIAMRSAAVLAAAANQRNRCAVCQPPSEPTSMSLLLPLSGREPEGCARRCARSDRARTRDHAKEHRNGTRNGVKDTGSPAVYLRGQCANRANFDEELVELRKHRTCSWLQSTTRAYPHDYPDPYAPRGIPSSSGDVKLMKGAHMAITILHLRSARLLSTCCESCAQRGAEASEVLQRLHRSDCLRQGEHRLRLERKTKMTQSNRTRSATRLPLGAVQCHVVAALGTPAGKACPPTPRLAPTPPPRPPDPRAHTTLPTTTRARAQRPAFFPTSATKSAPSSSEQPSAFIDACSSLSIRRRGAGATMGSSSKAGVPGVAPDGHAELARANEVCVWCRSLG